MSNLPAGFVLDEPAGLPEGFVIDLPEDGGLREDATQFGSGFNEALSDIVKGADQILYEGVSGVGSLFGKQAPSYSEASRDGLIILGGSEPGTRSLGDFAVMALDKATAPPPDPSNKSAVFARRAGEVVGENAPLIAAPLGVAGQMSRVTPEAVNMAQTTLGRAGLDTVRMIQNAPGKAALAEGAASLVSGVGAGTANVLFPGNETADTIGQLAPLAPVAAVSATKGAYNAAKRMPVTGTVLDTVERGGRYAMETVRGKPHLPNEREIADAQAEAQAMLGQGMTPEGMKNLSEAEQVKQQIPGLEYSLAEGSGSPSLIATQRGIEGQASGSDLEGLVGRKGAQTEAIEQYARQRAPEGSEGPEYVFDTLSGRVDRIRGDIDFAGQTNAARRETLAGSLPTADKSSIGVTLRTALAEKKAQADAETARLMDSLGLTDVDMSVPFKDAQTRIRSLFKGEGVFDDAANRPKVLDDILNYSTPGVDRANDVPSVSFRDLMGLRSRIDDDLRDAISGANPSAKKVRQLTMLKAEVDGIIDEAASFTNPALAESLKTFRQYYKTQVVDRFRQGSAFKVRQKDGRGFYRIPDEQVAAQFFKDVQGAKQFKRTFGEDAPETEYLEAAALDSFRDTAVRDGVIVESRARDWLRKNNAVLNEFPGIKDRVTNLAKLNEGLLARNATLTNRARGIENGYLGKVLKAYENGTDPRALINRALASPKNMGKLVSSVRRNPQALNALKRQVWDDVTALSPQQMEGFLKKHDQSLRVLLGKDHLKSLNLIYKAKEIAGRVPTPTGKPINNSASGAFEKAVGSGPNQISSRVFAVKSGRTSPRYVIFDLLSRLMRTRSEAETERIMREALYDPELAKALANVGYSMGKHGPSVKRLNAYLFNIGVRQGLDREEQ